MNMMQKLKGSKMYREASSLWRLSATVNRIELTPRERFIGRVEIAYRIMKIVRLTSRMHKSGREIERHKNNLLLYNISMEEDVDECDCDRCKIFEDREKIALSNHLPIHEN